MDDQNNLVEEVFCLNYEVNTLADVLLRKESERWVPGFLYSQTEFSHIERYKLACQFSQGKNIIDVACGTGRGSNLLAVEGKAEHVSGVDIQPEAIRYSNHRFAAKNLAFRVGNAEALDIYDQYELAVSFETVEHLPNFKAFLSSIHKSLKKDGVFLISTPISALALDTKPSNPYHVQEWGFKEFQIALSEYFDIEKVYVQLYPSHSVAIEKPPRMFLSRTYHKLRQAFGGKKEEIEYVLMPDITGFSKIEEYKEQYNINEFGSSRKGYQIVLGKKKLS